MNLMYVCTSTDIKTEKKTNREKSPVKFCYLSWLGWKWRPIYKCFSGPENKKWTLSNQYSVRISEREWKKFDLKSQWNHKKSLLGVCSSQTICEGATHTFRLGKNVINIHFSGWLDSRPALIISPPQSARVIWKCKVDEYKSMDFNWIVSRFFRNRKWSLNDDIV